MADDATLAILYPSTAKKPTPHYMESVAEIPKSNLQASTQEQLAKTMYGQRVSGKPKGASK